MFERYEVAPSEQERLARNFSYHAPNEKQIERYGVIRSCAFNFSILLSELCPTSRELSLSLTKLDEVVMFANAAIARNENGHAKPV